MKFVPFLLSPLSPPPYTCYCYGLPPWWALQPSGIGGQVAASMSALWRASVTMPWIQLQKVKPAESVAVSEERAGCVKLPSDNIALIVLPDSNTVDAQARVPESDSGSAKGIWSVFQYTNVLRLYIWGLQGPSPLCRGMRDSTRGYGGLKKCAPLH